MTTLKAEQTLTITGAVNIAEVPKLLPQLQGQLPAGDVRVDLGTATNVDSATVSLLLHLARTVTGRGNNFCLVNVPDSLSALIGLYGVNSLLLADANA